MPLGVNILVQPYLENPYLKKQTEGGLVLSDAEFDNNESGELEKLAAGIGCGLVLEVGSDCKSVRPGDDVFYDYRTARPVPFMGQGFLLTHEPGLICIIAEGLKERLCTTKNEKSL